MGEKSAGITCQQSTWMWAPTLPGMHWWQLERRRKRGYPGLNGQCCPGLPSYERCTGRGGRLQVDGLQGEKG